MRSFGEAARRGGKGFAFVVGCGLLAAFAAWLGAHNNQIGVRHHESWAFILLAITLGAAFGKWALLAPLVAVVALLTAGADRTTGYEDTRGIVWPAAIAGFIFLEAVVGMGIGGRWLSLRGRNRV
jgi:hypothetical protein